MAVVPKVHEWIQDEGRRVVRLSPRRDSLLLLTVARMTKTQMFDCRVSRMRNFTLVKIGCAAIAK
jgi:hypothetical protein